MAEMDYTPEKGNKRIAEHIKSKKLIEKLNRVGISSIDDLLEHTRKEMESKADLNPRDLKTLRQLLLDHGLYFQQETHGINEAVVGECAREGIETCEYYPGFNYGVLLACEYTTNNKVLSLANKLDMPHKGVFLGNIMEGFRQIKDPEMVEPNENMLISKKSNEKGMKYMLKELPYFCDGCLESEKCYKSEVRPNSQRIYVPDKAEVIDGALHMQLRSMDVSGLTVFIPVLGYDKLQS